MRRSLQTLVIISAVGISGCFFFEGPGGGSGGGDQAANTAPVLGDSLGPQAGGPDAAALDSIYALTSDQAPAPIRPDPDMYMRRLLRQYRAEGRVVAQQIGRLEEFRLLIGGANEDFSKAPQETYDATSLLATQKVSEEICTALVAPNGATHPGWTTILPHAPDNTYDNLIFLAQRITGRPSNEISDATVQQLSELLYAVTPGDVTYASYIEPCVMLTMDAEALYL